MGDLTLSQMKDQVRLALGNREDLDVHLTPLINTCQLRVARYFDFEELVATTDLTISYTGDAFVDGSVSLPTGTRELHGINILDSGDLYHIQAVDHKQWKDHYYPLYGSTTGRPSHYSSWGNKIEFYSPPDKAYTAKVRYTKWPDDLTSDNDKSGLDKKDDLIVALTICWPLYHLNNPDRANAYWAIFRSMMKESIDAQNMKPDLHMKIDSLAPDMTGDYWKQPFIKAVR